LNPKFQPDLVELMGKDWLDSGEEISVAEGTFKVSNQKIEVIGFVEGKTGGNKRGYIPISLTVVSPSMKSVLNFAPAFVTNPQM
jgi:hypothetical protein